MMLSTNFRNHNFTEAVRMLNIQGSNDRNTLVTSVLPFRLKIVQRTFLLLTMIYKGAHLDEIRINYFHYGALKSNIFAGLLNQISLR